MICTVSTMKAEQGQKAQLDCKCQKGQKNPTSYLELSLNALAWVTPKPHSALSQILFGLKYEARTNLTHTIKIIRRVENCTTEHFLHPQSLRVIICRDHCAGLDTDYLLSVDNFSNLIQDGKEVSVPPRGVII